MRPPFIYIVRIAHGSLVFHPTRHAYKGLYVVQSLCLRKAQTSPRLPAAILASHFLDSSYRIRVNGGIFIRLKRENGRPARSQRRWCASIHCDDNATDKDDVCVCVCSSRKLNTAHCAWKYFDRIQSPSKRCVCRYNMKWKERAL